jgi:hypothetical protein
VPSAVFDLSLLVNVKNIGKDISLTFKSGEPGVSLRAGNEEEAKAVADILRSFCPSRTGSKNASIDILAFAKVGSPRNSVLRSGTTPGKPVGPVQGQPQGHGQGAGATSGNQGKAEPYVKAKPYVFLSHAWGNDQMGRDNHARVAEINDRLKCQNIDTWFDSQGDMKDDTVLAMTNGIEACDLVIVFVTRAYIDKCKKKGNDNCKLELNYAYTHKTVERLVSVVMEPDCGAPASWDGPVSAYVGTHLYIGCMGNDDSDFDDATLELSKRIHEKFDELDLPPRAQPRASAVVNTTVASAVSRGVKTLICCCNPDGLLELDAANDEVDELAKLCPNNKVLTNPSVRQFQQEMDRFQPNCLVFIGHGDVPLRGDLTLGFVGENGGTEIVDPTTIAKILRPHQNTLKAVLLNGCTTIELAKSLYEKVGIPHVVGWSSPVVDEAAQIFSSGFFSVLNSECTNAKQAFNSACRAVEIETEPDGNGRSVQKYELTDPLNRALVDHSEFPHRSKTNGRIAAGQPICLSHDNPAIRDWLLLAPSMDKLSKELVMFKEPVNQETLHILDHCAPLRAVEGEDKKKLMALKTTMDSLEDAEMQKRRYNIGALHDETESTDTKGSFDADKALMALEVSLVAVLGPAACGKTTTMHKLAYRQLQNALKNPDEPIPIMIHVYRLTAMLKHLQQRHSSGAGAGGGFDLTKCDMLMEFVGDTTGYGLGICGEAELEAYKRLLNGELGNVVCCIFDGMDEGGQYKAEIEMHIKRLASRPHMRVIVSSRETGFDHTHFGGALDKLFQILPLTSAMKRDVISLRIEHTQQDSQEARENKVTRLHEQIQSKFLELSRNPLLLSLLIVNYNKHQKLPRNRFELYKDGTELMMNTYRKRAFKGLVSQIQEQKASALLDKAGASSEVSAADRRNFFRQLAMKIHDGRGRDIVSIMVEGGKPACLAASTPTDELRAFLAKASLHPDPEGLEAVLLEDYADTASDLLLLKPEDLQKMKDDHKWFKIKHVRKLERAIEGLRSGDSSMAAADDAPDMDETALAQEELEIIRNDSDVSTESREQITKFFNDLVRERCGLLSLVARETDPRGGEERRIYRFPHLTFQEYFASEQMIEDIEKDLEGKEDDAVHEVFERHLGKDNESKLYDVWFREIVLFITCGLSSGAFEKLVDFLLSTDDGIGAVQTRVHQMMKERGMIDSNDPVVMEQRQQIYARISQTRTTEFMAMALMHPSKSLRELALSELREYRMDSLSIANAILLQVNGGGFDAGGAGGGSGGAEGAGKRGPQSKNKISGLDSVGLLKYDSDTKKGPQREKSDIVAQLVRVWTDSETHDRSLRSEAGTAIAALKAHASPVVREALCAQLQDTGQSDNSVTEALGNIQIFVLTEEEARGPDTEKGGQTKADVVAAVLSLLGSKSFASAACNAILALASPQHMLNAEGGWMAPAIAEIKRLAETNPQQALLVLKLMAVRSKRFCSEVLISDSDFKSLVVRHLQPEIEEAVQLQAVQTATVPVFMAVPQICECLLSLARKGSDEVKLQIVSQVLPALMGLEEFGGSEANGADDLVLSIARDKSATLPLRKAALGVAKTTLAATASASKGGRLQLPRQNSVLTKVQAAELVTELEAEWCANDKLAADWLQAMLRAWEPEQAVLKMLSVLQSDGPIRTTGMMMCDPNIWGSFLCDERIHAVLVSIAVDSDCERSFRMEVFPQLVCQIAAAKEATKDAESVLPREKLICILTDGAWNPPVQQEAIMKLSGLLLKGSWGVHDDLLKVVEGLVTHAGGDSRTQLRALALLPMLDKAVCLRTVQDLLEKPRKPEAALADASTEGTGTRAAGTASEEKEAARLLRRGAIKLACSSKHKYFEDHKIRMVLVRSMSDSRFDETQCQVLELMTTNFGRAIIEEVRAIQGILEDRSLVHKVRVAAVAALKMLTPEQLQQPHSREPESGSTEAGGGRGRDLVSSFIALLEECTAYDTGLQHTNANHLSLLKAAIEATAHQELLLMDPRVRKVFLALVRQSSDGLSDGPKKKGLLVVRQALLAPMGKVVKWLQTNGQVCYDELTEAETEAGNGGAAVVAKGKQEEEAEGAEKAEKERPEDDVASCFLEVTTTLATDEDEAIASKAQAMLTDFGREADVAPKSTNVAVLRMLDMLADSRASPFLFEPLLLYFRRQRDAHFEERAKQPQHGGGVQGQADQEAGWVLDAHSSSKLEAHLPSKATNEATSEASNEASKESSSKGTDAGEASDKDSRERGGCLEAIFLSKDMKVGKFTDGTIPYWKGQKIKAMRKVGTAIEKTGPNVITAGIHSETPATAKGSQRKQSRISVVEIETANELAKAIFEARKVEDEDGERFFEEECLMKLCTDNGLIGSKLSVKAVTMIFSQVKMKKKSYLSFERFQEAMRKIATTIEKTYQELITELADSASKKDNYELIKQLGRGGHGSTMHVKHKASGKEYAAKLIMCHDLEEVLAANDEAKVMQSMKGPQFVQFVESFFVPAALGTYELYIIMEYCARGDLERFITEAEGRRLSEEVIGQMLTPVLEGLRQMHARDLVHRDVKPANILVSSSGLGMLADFGLAKHLDRASQTGANTQQVGSFLYMAPEIEQGLYSATVDVFAFGIVLLVACGVKLTEPLRTQADVDSALAQLPTDVYSDNLVTAIRAAITIKTEEQTRPSALDLLKTTFFAPHFDALPDEMIK